MSPLPGLPALGPATLGFVICLTLLWIGAAVSAEARAPGAPRPRIMSAVSILLSAIALAWPAYLADRATPALGTSTSVIALVLATALALGAAARSSSHRGALGRDAVAASALTLTLCLALLTLLNGLPGDGLALGLGGPLLLSLLLAAALRVLHHPWRNAARAWRLQLPAAALAAAIVGAVTYRVPAGAMELDPALPPMLALAALGVAMVLQLRHSRQQRQSAGRPAASAAAVDLLSGLPNRAALEARLARLTDPQVARPRPFALMMLNLDGFKAVNASYGHPIGDQLLKQASQRLRRHLRPRDFLARLAADEFAIVSVRLEGDEHATTMEAAQALIAAIAPPYVLGAREVSLTGSIGVALSPEHGEPERLLARCDAAMRFSKRAGGNRASLFSAEMETNLAEDLDLLRDLRRAIEGDEFELVFQPKINAASGQITAAEALLRWRHPQRGEIPPAVFVALAERFGLVMRLGDWVIENACRQARLWADRGLNMRVAINLSAQHMRQSDLAARIASTLARYRIEPTRLTCEITETLAMENTQATQATFAQLGAAGVHISIDDFGTGYSSLAYLRGLPASEIKIDKSFVQDLERSSDARAIVDAVVKLAHALGKRVVAEGVETLRQRRILTELGCDELQGFLFARPMAAQDLLAWAIDDRQRDEQAFRQSLYVNPDDQTQLIIAAARSSARSVKS
ncbi:MAG TPA: bifunctional diguanylate cyclase/phosphodiesterase [Burkholderiaceae bacterium]|nr:bifunctional diguanylate cyclase/phosphodiesterase [Burkholderiaceae bacterium]